MSKKNLIRGLVFTLFLLFFCWEKPVLADSQNGFSISPINPETGAPQSNYYDLKVVPNQKKDLNIRIFNSQNQDIIINIQANEAGTNSNGVITYTGDEEKDVSLLVPFSDIAYFDEEQVVIPKNDYKDVTLHIQIPNEPFKGIILGGIRVTEKDSSESSKDQQASVKAKIAYSVAVVLKEEEETIDPSMHLLEVKKEVRNYQKYISAELQNSAPCNIKNLETKASIYKKGSSKLLYQAEKTTMEMAPNSKFKFGINLGEQTIKPGKYLMKVSGKADGKNYSFEKEFKITKQEVKDYSKNGIYIAKDDSEQKWPLIFLICICMLLLLTLVGLIIWYKKNNRNSKGDN